jgi:hypothetical protein
MKKLLTGMISIAVLFMLLTVCSSTSQREEAAAPYEYASAFIDFSAITEIWELESHQPPEDSEFIQGPFTLDNGITGDGLRVSNMGDTNEVDVVQYGGKTALQTKNGDYLYFFIDNDIIMRAGIITIEIVFFDNASGGFNFQYVRKGHDFYPIAVNKGGTNTYVTVRLELDACNFMSGRQNQDAQFRFESGTIVQSVKVVTGGMGNPVGDPPPEFAIPTSLNNMIGKGVAGYQVWFRPNSNWHHWGSGGKPGPGNVNIELWPSGWEDYLANGATLYDTNFVMPDRMVARVFNSPEAAAIRTQLMWMRDAGLDGAAVQRFFEETSPVDTGNSPNHLTFIRDAAQEYGRIFYVMYDMTASGSRRNPDQNVVIKRMQLDWIYNVERKGLVSSPNYAQAEGKPVVFIWGLDVIEDQKNSHFITVNAAIELVQWFRDRGYYVIGGLPDNTFWEQGGGRHRRGIELYSLFDMISPWYIGRDVEGQILSGGQWQDKGLEFCRRNPRKWAENRPIDFMPTVWPGFAWSNMGGPGAPNQGPRNAGQWAWVQIQNYLNRDPDNVIRSIYFAMMDEYDEGTAWMKAGTDFFDIPLEQYFQTHSADGKWLSSDYYLRIAGASIQALKRKINAGGGSSTPGNAGYTGPLNDYGNANSVIVEHSNGPVFWRNSFERRNGRTKLDTGRSLPANHLQIDVGVPSGGVVGSPQNVTVAGDFTINRPAVRGGRADRYEPPSETLGMIYTANARSGGSAFRIAGERTAGSGASYLYRIAETRIKVSGNMSLSFWQRAENALGANVTVDLLLDNGSYLSSSAGYNVRNDGAAQGGWQKKTVAIPGALANRYITAVIVTYKDSAATTGSFAALIDDIIISNN